MKLHRASLLCVALVLFLASLPACRWNDALQLDLKLSPDHPRMTQPITFTLHISDANGRAVNDAKVVAALTMKSMEMGKAELQFTPRGNGDYEASLKDMDMSGQWALTIDAVRGTAHDKKIFDFTVGD